MYNFILNYDLNSLKVAKLVSTAEARRRQAWAGAKRGGPVVRIRVLLYNPFISRRNIIRRSFKHSTKIVKIVAAWCP
jgi:hypothetical protein